MNLEEWRGGRGLKKWRRYAVYPREKKKRETSVIVKKSTERGLSRLSTIRTNHQLFEWPDSMKNFGKRDGSGLLKKHGILPSPSRFPTRKFASPNGILDRSTSVFRVSRHVLTPPPPPLTHRMRNSPVPQ